MTAILSATDVARLLADPSAGSREDLARKLGQQLSETSLGARELALAHDILRLLAEDVEDAVRAALSRGMRLSPYLPRDLALRMADDIDSVALPILAASLVLTDDDLIDLIGRVPPRKQQAMAARTDLAAAVSGAIVAQADVRAVTTLMANATAHIGAQAMEQALDRFGDNEPMKERMAMRPTLPPAVAERLVALVSAHLQAHIVRNHELSPSLAADLVLSGRESVVVRLSSGSDEPDLIRMVEQMKLNGRLTPSLVVRSLCTGDLGFFEAAMTALTDVPVANTRMLIHDHGGKGLEQLYRRSGLPQDLLPMVRAAVEAVDDSRFDGEKRDLKRFRSRVIARVLTQAEACDPADTDYLVSKLGDLLLAE
jgi:uncharacterized protein (DUF2336 family)